MAVVINATSRRTNTEDELAFLKQEGGENRRIMLIICRPHRLCKCRSRNSHRSRAAPLMSSIYFFFFFSFFYRERVKKVTLTQQKSDKLSLVVTFPVMFFFSSSFFKESNADFLRRVKSRTRRRCKSLHLFGIATGMTSLHSIPQQQCHPATA
ncbi:hypothetical protein PUN28_007643 [Cardiocondyla obscurior]|uniref:Uncharacterized protein n=1 Tax=Cardiocondyla obscurior TaxID=286306 RepID=A0AAW2G6P3_9HYME